jgi:glc operon protein GlcG
MRVKTTIDLGDANDILGACKRMAHEVGAPVSIAIVDDAGVLLCFERLERARVHTVELAQRKARTAALLSVSTKVLESMAREGRLQSAEVLAQGGGLPVIYAGECAGGIGVSGSTTEIDDQVAAAGLKAFVAIAGSPA